MIYSFTGKYEKFNPYTIHIVDCDGAQYPSIVNAVEASKFANYMKKRIMQLCLPSAAFKMGAAAPYTEEQVDLCQSLIREAYSEDTELLLSMTGSIVFANNFHDNFYGACSCPKCSYAKKYNWVGKTLEDMRDELKEG